MNRILMPMSRFLKLVRATFLQIIFLFGKRQRAFRLDSLLQIDHHRIALDADIKWSLTMLVEHEHFLWLLFAVELQDIVIIFDDLMGLCVTLLV